MKSLAEIVLDLSFPLDKIGAFTVHDTGVVSLSNRPLTSRLVTLENNGIPSGISPSTCYTTTETYVSDLLRCHDARLSHQPNAARDSMDAEGQMAVIVALRALSATLTRRHLRDGPFCMALTDLNAGNIFVDQSFNISTILDLEFSCSQPLEMLYPPIWLSGMVLDDFLDEHPDETKIERSQHLEHAWEDFFCVLEQAESVRPQRRHIGKVSEIMRETVKLGSHWYFMALHSPRMSYDIFMTLLQPQIDQTHGKGDGAIDFQRIATPYWGLGARVSASVFAQNHVRYLEELRARRQQPP